MLKVLLALLLSLPSPQRWFVAGTTSNAPYTYGTGVAIDVPVEDGSHAVHLNYLTMLRKQAVVESLTAQFSVQVTDSPIWNYLFIDDPGNTCVNTAHVRLIVGVNSSKSLPLEYQRWWSNPIAFELNAGDVQLVVPIDPAQWSSVYGEKGNGSIRAESAFNALMNKPDYVGFTFGGGCFFGHGVNVSNGTARFVVWSLQ